MLTLDEVSKKLQDRTLTKVAASTGLSYPTVWKIANGCCGDVTYESIRKLSDYLESTA